MNKEFITDWFSYHKPSADEVKIMERWRWALTEIAADFTEHTPDNGDKVVALRALKTAMMAMNAALVAPMPKG